MPERRLLALFRDFRSLPGIRYLVEWCIVPVEMYVGFGVAVALGVE